MLKQTMDINPCFLSFISIYSLLLSHITIANASEAVFGSSDYDFPYNSKVVSRKFSIPPPLSPMPGGHIYFKISPPQPPPPPPSTL